MPRTLEDKINAISVATAARIKAEADEAAAIATRKQAEVNEAASVDSLAVSAGDGDATLEPNSVIADLAAKVAYISDNGNIVRRPLAGCVVPANPTDPTLSR